MRERPQPPPGPWLVVGLARSGVAAARLLRARGEEVTGVDAGRPDVDLGAARTVLGSDGVALLDGVRAVVKSPGVPAQAAVIAAARERGIPVLGELELAWRCVPGEVIAVTGTNGKTTTTELIGHVHRVAGEPVAVAGNVGTPYSSIDGRGTVVVEASSFQLEDTLAFAPECAVLLNVAPDHLDRHGTFGAYVEAKLQVFARQSNDDVAVAPSDLEIPDLGGCARRVCFGARPDDELSDRAGALWWDGELLIRHEELALRGAHNRANASAAAAACLSRGLDREAVAEGLRTFAGVPHRLEEVARHGDVVYVNDSKATNVASALVALASFDAPVNLIAGGQAKGQDFAPLRAAVAARCRGVYLIGEDAGQIAAALEGAVALHDCGTLERAVKAARAAAQPGDVVLLSPACASFDQFADFEARGAAFKDLVG